MTCLVKLLDSAERLVIQVHPTVEFAKENTFIQNSERRNTGIFLAVRIMPMFISALRRALGISFNRRGVLCAKCIETKAILKQKNCSLNIHSVIVEIIPMLGISRNTGIHSEISVRICICTFSVW